MYMRADERICGCYGLFMSELDFRLPLCLAWLCVFHDSCFNQFNDYMTMRAYYFILVTMFRITIYLLAKMGYL